MTIAVISGVLFLFISRITPKSLQVMEAIYHFHKGKTDWKTGGHS